MKYRMCKTEIPPTKWTIENKLDYWVVYYVAGKWRRIKAKRFKTEKGAYRFYNNLATE